MKISARLKLGFGIVCVLFFVISVFGIVKINEIRGIYEDIFKKELTAVELFDHYTESILAYQSKLLHFTSTRSRTHLQELEEIQKKTESYMIAYQEFNKAADKAAEFGQLNTHQNKLFAMMHKAKQFIEKHPKDIKGSLRELSAVFDYYDNQYRPLIEMQHEKIFHELKTIKEAVSVSSRRSIWLMIILAVISIVLVAYIAYSVSHRIINGLSTLKNAAEKVSIGQLDEDLRFLNSKDEVGELAASFNRMRLSLKKTLERIESSQYAAT